jgi:hypothetical protein
MVTSNSFSSQGFQLKKIKHFKTTTRGFWNIYEQHFYTYLYRQKNEDFAKSINAYLWLMKILESYNEL